MKNKKNANLFCFDSMSLYNKQQLMSIGCLN
jgi:hypothetical protein